MNRTWIVLAMIFLAPSASSAQEYSLIAKAGISDYASYEFVRSLDVGLGDGEDDSGGGLGPMLSLGVRLRIHEVFAVDGLVEYSTHQYPQQWDGNSVVRDPDNGILDLNLLGRFGVPVSRDTHVNLLGGIGLYSQSNEQYNPTGKTVIPGSEYAGVGGLAGLGVEMMTSARMGLAIEVMWRVRRHTTTTLQLGIAFRIGDRLHD